MYLVLDLETIPDLSRWSPPADKPDAFAPTWAQRIVCIGYAVIGRDYRSGSDRLGSFRVFDDGDLDSGEHACLSSLSRLVADHMRSPGGATLVTFNGRSFDLPVIAMRSLCHGVQLPWYYKNRDVRYRFSEEGHLDLCDSLTDYGASTKCTLDALAKLIGLPGKVGVDGSQVEALFRAEKYAEIERYCLADVAQTALLLLRFRLIQGALKQREYSEARYALMEWFCADARLSDVFGKPAIPPEPNGAPVDSVAVTVHSRAPAAAPKPELFDEREAG